jgi:hypothetical protein
MTGRSIFSKSQCAFLGEREELTGQTVPNLSEREKEREVVD